MSLDIDPQLLATLSSNPNAARQMLEAAASEAGADPRLGVLLQMMSARQATEALGSDQAEPRRAKVARVKRRLHALQEEVAELRALSEDLAGALGACARCWGESRRCEDCGGDGSPGWMEPDARLFDELIAPAVERRSGAANDKK